MESRRAILALLLLVGIIFSIFYITNVSALEVALIQSNLSHQGSSVDVLKVTELFNKNNLNLSNFQITKISVTTELADNPEAMYYNVQVNQVYKGLPLFFENVVYGFNKEGNKVYGTDRRLISNNGKDISIIPTITMDAAARKVISEYPNKFSEDKLTAELGIYNKNSGNGEEANYVLIWRIGINDSKYPYAFVDANNNEIYYEDEGIRTVNEEVVVPHDNWNAKTNCNLDSDCTILNKNNLFDCCGECGKPDFSKEDYISISKRYVSSMSNCVAPFNCPACVTELNPNNENWTSKCVNNICTKVNSEQRFCSEEAKQCPDGKVIGRNISNRCEFDKCLHILSNGRSAEIKIMPETASANAIERLGDLGFNITLKELPKKNEDIPRLAYHLEGKKEGKILGLFKKEGKIDVEVDAESDGNILSVKKPWWAFIATGI